MRLQAFHCPSCAARLDINPGAGKVKCAYCGNSLLVEDNAVSSSAHAAHAGKSEEKPAYPEPGATLYTREAARFEMSVIEQKIPEGTPDRFTHIELGDERFALVYLRFVDANGAPVAGQLETPFQDLRQSLESDGDPGLAANVALDGLCRGSFANRMECAILMFEPRHMTMTAYNAGCRDAVWWVSNEEGRSICPNSYHDALERRMLREARDHFSNSSPVHLAAGDLFVAVSAGFAGRGGSGRWPSGISSLTEVLNDHLGEDPLRVVTLAKNAFWAKRNSWTDGGAPCGDVKIAGVRAIPPPLAAKIPGEGKIEVLRTRKYEIAHVKGPRDQAKLLPLHGDRQVFVWISPAAGEIPAGAFDAASRAILAVLDGDTGDNDNPRCAGRDAYAAMKLSPAQVRMAVIQTLDIHGRVKYFRAGWKQPVALGPRGLKSDYGQQQFDEGGEATVHPGARLFFPGPLVYEGEHHLGESFGQTWEGGKASRLYEAMGDHWKTKRSDMALEKLALAAASDAKVADVVGMAVVTGT